MACANRSQTRREPEVVLQRDPRRPTALLIKKAVCETLHRLSRAVTFLLANVTAPRQTAPFHLIFTIIFTILVVDLPNNRSPLPIISPLRSQAIFRPSLQ